VSGLTICDCKFCLLANPSFRGAGEDWWNEPVLETANFVVWPSLGSLVPGWLLVVPRRHTLCLSSLDRARLDDLGRLESLLRTQLGSVYGLPVSSFEHGPRRPGDPVACTIDHAHLHVVPTSIDLKEAAGRLTGLTWTAVTGLSECQARHRQGLSYIYLRSPDERQFVLADTSLPSQLMRRAMAGGLAGNLNWDWRSDHRLPTARETRNTLAPVLAG
jgi:diadenosine tetraphosphate (Ap4A) HIT family hydrolase